MAGYQTGGMYWEGKWYPSEAAVRQAQEQKKARLEQEQLSRASAAAAATPQGSQYAISPFGGISFQGGAPTSLRTSGATGGISFQDDDGDPTLTSLRGLRGTTEDVSFQGSAPTPLWKPPTAVASGPTESEPLWTQAAADLQQRQQLQDAQAAEDTRRRRELQEKLLAELRSGSTTPPVSPPVVDTSAAQAEALARAKERSGRIARASLNSLYDLMAATGRSGSNIEASLAGGLTGTAAGELSDLNREQMIQDLLSGERRASERYQGELTQRGQDLSRRASLLGLLQSLY